MRLPSADFESAASASSAIPARRLVYPFVALLSSFGWVGCRDRGCRSARNELSKLGPWWPRGRISMETVR